MFELVIMASGNREQNIQTIIMLTEIIEIDREQCYPYWPDYGTIDSLESGDLSILARSKVVKEDYQISTFLLRRKGVSYTCTYTEKVERVFLTIFSYIYLLRILIQYNYMYFPLNYRFLTI